MKRLPLYLEYLQKIPGEDCNISAAAIARALGFGEVQVRKDLAKISAEGRCRTGRSRDQLIRDIGQCLASTCDTASIIVGEGALEENLLDSMGVNVLACFDINPTRKRMQSGKPVYSIRRLESFCRCYDVRIGIIAVPREKAQAVCDGLIACGIQSIWNLSPGCLRVPQGIRLHSVDLETA